MNTQYQLELELEPVSREPIEWSEIELVRPWFDNTEYEQEKAKLCSYDSMAQWTDCWQKALAILESKDNHSQSAVSLAESIFAIMCKCDVVPVVEGRLNGIIARNQLD